MTTTLILPNKTEIEVTNADFNLEGGKYIVVDGVIYEVVGSVLKGVTNSEFGTFTRKVALKEIDNNEKQT